ncbi:MAG: response regulator [Proteobacteria bacterium]|nr:response regulator [Pseudomonadota bacterium]
MRRFAQLSIQHKVTILALSSSLLVLLTASIIFIARERGAARREAREILSTRAEIIGEGLIAALDFNDPRPIQEALDRLARDPHMVGAAAYASDGRLLARYPKTFTPPPILPRGRVFKGDQLHLAAPIERGGRVIGTLYFVRDTIELQEQTKRTLLNFAFAALIANALGILLSLALHRIISKPLLDLAATSHAVAVSHDFSVRAVKSSPDEIGELVDRFNQMLAELQNRDAALAQARNELEVRVTDRTLQLTNTLEQLQAEIRDRESAQQALQRAQEKLLLHVAQTPMAVIDWNPQFEVVSWNPAAERIFGYPAAEAVGRRGPELIVPAASRAQVDTIWQGLLQRTGGEHGVNQNITREGRMITCEWFNTPLVNAEGQVIGVSSFCADISARISLEHQFRQSQKMQAVGQLAAGVAHDFNNLLTVIRGNTSLIEMNPDLTEEDRGFLRELQAACTRAAALVHQLLAFSRKQVIQPKPLDLNELVVSDTKMLARLLGEPIALRCTYNPTPVMVHADRGMLDQIIVNLAVNARDAMPGGGTLRVSTGLVTVDAARHAQNGEARAGHFSCLIVTDTGCGMDAATQARIFEPFFTTKEVGQGTGLGLATVYGIVKQHEGWIECTSAPNQGTTFKIFLPQYTAAPATPVPALETDASLRGTETVLLVEDEPAVRDIGQRTLTRLGYRVLVANSGPEALQVWQAHKVAINLLVTDMMMPGGMSGLDLVQRLQQDRPNLRIIYSSGHSPDLFAGKVALTEGINFLPKPYTLTILGRTVRAALDAA